LKKSERPSAGTKGKRMPSISEKGLGAIFSPIEKKGKKQKNPYRVFPLKSNKREGKAGFSLWLLEGERKRGGSHVPPGVPKKKKKEGEKNGSRWPHFCPRQREKKKKKKRHRPLVTQKVGGGGGGKPFPNGLRPARGKKQKPWRGARKKGGGKKKGKGRYSHGSTLPRRWRKEKRGEKKRKAR